jgi:hypothetical protein
MMKEMALIVSKQTGHWMGQHFMLEEKRELSLKDKPFKIENI